MQIDTSLLPARGNDAVEILENDHEVIKELLDQLTSATNSKRADVLELLKGVLTIHNATEENLVYPAINKVAGSKLESQHLYHETAEADVLFFELDSLRDAVLHHIDEEENKAFPRLEENGDPQNAASLTESMREFRKSLRFQTKD
jgi:hemerythrin superfamily protein